MKILFLQKRPLFPANTGGKIRTLNILRHLARWHDVTYLCNVQRGEESAVQEMTELGIQVETIPWSEVPRGGARFYGQLLLNLVSRYPYNVAKDFDARLKTRARQLLEAGDYDLLICDFVQMVRNAIGLPGPPKVLFQHNVEAEIFERHAKTDRSRARRWYMKLQWRKMQRFEKEAGAHFDAAIAVSQRDRQIFQEVYGWQHVETIDTAVDVDYFKPNGHVESADRVVFVGSMDWLPNEDGVEWFARNVWPQIREVRPEATFQIVGRNPNAAVRKLADVDGVEVVGTVPDVRPYLQTASLVVVPLLVGGGTRIKIFEAMAMEKAVVSTSLGAEGLNVSHDTHLRIANEPAALAAAVTELLADERRRREIARNARELVCRDYSSETVAKQFDRICRGIVQQRESAA